MLKGRALTIKSLDIATEAHTGQYRRDEKTPYLIHPVAVAMRFNDPILQSIAYLHDVIEDSDMTLGDLLKQDIPLIVVNAVNMLTKREDFRETKSKRKVTDPEKLKILTKAKDIAEEWVTPMRLNHILDKIKDPSLQKMREIIISMQEDIKREAKGEILWNKHAEKAIGRKTAYMTKEYFKNKLKEKKQ